MKHSLHIFILQIFIICSFLFSNFKETIYFESANPFSLKDIIENLDNELIIMKLENDLKNQENDIIILKSKDVDNFNKLFIDIESESIKNYVFSLNDKKIYKSNKRIY